MRMKCISGSLKRFKDKLLEDTKWIYVGILGTIFLFVLIILPSSFAVLQPIKSIEIYSENLSYQNEEPGAWKVTESAKWISKNKAKIKIDVDSVTAVNSKKKDVLFVLNNSIYMYKALDNAIISINNTMNKILESQENKVALLSFNNNYEILSGFTNDKDLLNNKLSTLTPSGESSYYSALVGVDKFLQDYEYNYNRDCTVVFLISALSTRDVPNEKAFYKYLKNKYPFITVNAVQYNMSNNIVKQIKDISDNVYISSNNLNEAMSKAVDSVESYDYFSFKDNIDSNYFKIESASSNEGNIKIDTEDNSLIWNIDRFRTGSKVSLEIVLQRNNFDSDYYVVNKGVEANSKLTDKEGRVISSSSPILKDKYQVSYDGNFPSGCTSTEVPTAEINNVFDTVGVSNVKLKCNGYNFKGWRLKTSRVENINDDYFIMPEDDVVFVAEWSKTSLKKSVDGTIYVHIPPILQSVTRSYAEEIWAYKDSITKIVIQDEISIISGTIQSYDLSEKKDGKIIGRIVSNGNNTYTAYIQGDGKIMANTNSSYLFYNFSNLNSIEGLDKLDTSNVVKMDAMFFNCTKLTSLDLRNFNTSNVTSMGWMFGSNWDRPMMSLTSINVTSFNTSNVTNMDGMFYNCANIVNLDLSKFDTSKVVSLEQMFCHCVNLKSINLGEFIIGNVTSLVNMFDSCSNLSANITIKGNNITIYTGTFTNAALSSNGAKITVNYTSANSALVDSIIATKAAGSNIVKGRMVAA